MTPTAQKFYSFQIPGYEYEFFGRVNDQTIISCDHRSRELIFDFNAYSGLNRYELLKVPGAKVIVDLGAHAGYASRYYLHAYPDARVIAVEPYLESFDLAKRNLHPYGDRTMLVNAAAWSHECDLFVTPGPEDRRPWAFRTLQHKSVAHLLDESGGLPLVHALNIDQIVPPGLQIDILKINVEHAEAHIFAANYKPWLDRTRNIIIEINDKRYFEIIANALRDYHIEDCFSINEMTVFKGIKPL